MLNIETIKLPLFEDACLIESFFHTSTPLFLYTPTVIPRGRGHYVVDKNLFIACWEKLLGRDFSPCCFMNCVEQFVGNSLLLKHLIFWHVKQDAQETH